MRFARYPSLADDRALAWKCLFPDDTVFEAIDHPDGVPAFDARRIGTGSPGPRVVIAEGAFPEDFAVRHHLPGAVVFNGSPGFRPSLARLGFSHIQHFAVLPSLRDPRLFVPLRSPRSSAAALAAFAPIRPRARLLHTITRLATKTPSRFWYRDTVTIATRSRSPLETLFHQHLGEQDPVLALSSGTLGPSRKVTVAVLRPSGDLLAYAKLWHPSLSSSPLAGGRIAAEAKLLQALNALPQGAPIAPEFIAEDHLGETTLLLQKPLDGTPGPPTFGALHAVFLARLQCAPSAPVTASALFRSLAPRITALARGAEQYRAAHDLAARLLHGLLVPGTITHGDFAPWNTRVAAGRLAALDWEYGDVDGLPLFDELHYRLQSGFLLKGWTTDDAMRELITVAAAGSPHLSVVHRSALILLYLLHQALLRLEEGHPPDDDALAHYRHLLAEMTRQAYLEAVPRMGL